MSADTPSSLLKQTVLLAGAVLMSVLIQTHTPVSAWAEEAATQEISLDESGATPTPTLIVLKSASEPANATPVVTEDVASPTDTPTEVPTDTPTEVVTETPTDTPTDTPTVETEVVLESPTDTPTEVVPDTPTFTPTVISEDQEVEISEAATRSDKRPSQDKAKRLGLSPTWFDYLVQAGYLVKNPSEVPQFGVIGESSHQDGILLTGMHLVIRQKGKSVVKAGDRLIVYRVMDRYTDPETGDFLGSYVMNLGSLKVTRVDGSMVQADVVKTFAPFFRGDKVKLFDDELERWKKSRRRQSPPLDPVECSVVGMPPGFERALMNDTLILGVGEDQGVVAGMDFEVKKPVEASVSKRSWVKIGKARVFYVGGKYSLAKVLWNQDLILRGYRAVYQP